MVRRDRPTAERGRGEWNARASNGPRVPGRCTRPRRSCARPTTCSTRCSGKNGPPNGRRPRAKSSGPRWLRRWTARRPAAASWCWPVSVRNWTAATRRKPSQAIVLCDGERALWTTFTAMLTRPFVGILDLWHALTYLWLAAKVFHGSQAGAGSVRHRAAAAAVGRESRRRHQGPQADGHPAGLGGGEKTYAGQSGRLLGAEPRPHAVRPIPAGGVSHRQRRDRRSVSACDQGPDGTGGDAVDAGGGERLLRLRVVHTNGHWDEYQEYRIAREQKALYGVDAPFAMAA